MTELPDGWVETTLDEIAATSLGKMLDAKQRTGLHNTPYLRNVNVRWGAFDLSDVATMDIEPRELDRVLAQPGDLVACEGGEPGRSAVWRGSEPVALQKALHKIRPAAGVLPDYLALLLREQSCTGELEKLFTGTTIKHLPQEKLRLVGVPLAPTAEQERIVVAIDEAFSKLDAGEAGLRIVRQLLKRLRDAILTAAVTGRLVPQDATDTPTTKLLADLGVEPVSDGQEDLPPTWAHCAFDQCFAVVGDGGKRVAQRDYLDDGALAVVDQGDGLIGGFTNDCSARIQVTLPVAVFGDHTRRVKFVDFPFAVGASGTKVLRPSVQFLDARFAVMALGTRKLDDRGYGRHFALLRHQPLPIPPLSEQSRIVTEVERQLSFLDACERAVDAGLARGAATRRSVLKAAFEGKLVPQDPSDEPASGLLERIRAERAAVPKSARRSRRTA